VLSCSNCSMYQHLDSFPLMIFEIWLNTACSSGFKWEKSSPGFSVSSDLAKVSSSSLLVECKTLFSICKLLNCLVLFLLVEDSLVGSEAFRSRLLVMMSLLQVRFNMVKNMSLLSSPVIGPMFLVESKVVCCMQLLVSKIGKPFLNSGLLGNETCRAPGFKG
jgi:hypothetical protein